MTSSGVLHVALPLLAQSPGGFDAIFGYFLTVLATPQGIVLFALGALGIGLALLSRHSMEILAYVAMFLLSTMFDARETATTVNVLWGPL